MMIRLGLSRQGAHIGLLRLGLLRCLSRGAGGRLAHFSRRGVDLSLRLGRKRDRPRILLGCCARFHDTEPARAEARRLIRRCGHDGRGLGLG